MEITPPSWESSTPIIPRQVDFTLTSYRSRWPVILSQTAEKFYLPLDNLAKARTEVISVSKDGMFYFCLIKLTQSRRGRIVANFSRIHFLATSQIVVYSVKKGILFGVEFLSVALLQISTKLRKFGLKNNRQPSFSVLVMKKRVSFAFSKSRNKICSREVSFIMVPQLLFCYRFLSIIPGFLYTESKHLSSFGGIVIHIWNIKAFQKFNFLKKNGHY